MDRILQVRGESEYGDMSVRPRVKPQLNLSATSLVELISWKQGEVQEPVFTCHLSKEELRRTLLTPLPVPAFSSHTQSTERAVQQVTAAAEKVVGQQSRDGYIRAKAHHRGELPVFRTKRHILATF